jgi:5-methylthioadenosine/S-adenosylhomocysteine deaminase
MRFGDFHDFLPRALKRGIPVGLGSDGPASNSNMNILEAARLAALLAKGTTGRAEEGSLGQILPLLFGGGHLAGLDQPGIPYGTVVPGSLADLVLIKTGTPEMLPGSSFFADLLYGADGRNVDTVLVDGKVLVKEGRLTTINFEDLAREAREIAARLVSTRADKPMQTY